MLNLIPDGSITIDFPSDPPTVITIAPPKWGAYKRIRRERERIADALTDKVAALAQIESLPAPDDQSDEAMEKRRVLRPLYQERKREIEDLTGQALVDTWRFILLGNRTSDGGDFDGLASPRPPDSEDEWPAELMIDAGDIELNTRGLLVRTNETLLDAVHKHWGKARFRSGVIPGVQ